MFFLLIIFLKTSVIYNKVLSTQLLIVRKYAFKKMKGKVRQMILHHILRNINEEGVLKYCHIFIFADALLNTHETLFA